MFLGGYAVQSFELLRHYDLFGVLFPRTDDALSLQEQGYPITLVLDALNNTDERIRAGKPVTPAFLFAALLWEPVRIAAEAMEEELGPVGAFHEAASDVLAEQVRTVSIPRRYSVQTREIWAMQPRFRYIHGKRPARLLEHPTSTNILSLVTTLLRSSGVKRCGGLAMIIPS